MAAGGDRLGQGDDEHAVEPGDAAETADEAIARLSLELEGVGRQAVRDGTELSVAGRAFAVVAPGVLEVHLDPSIAAAALRTPGVAPSERGRGWIRFTPPRGSRSILDVDRAVSWLRVAHRAARGGH